LTRDIIKEITNQDYPAIAITIEKFLSDHMKKTNSDGVILGLSGGIDSAVLAYICKRKLKDKTVALIMPDSEITPKSETEDALKMIALTGITHKVIDINSIVNEYSMHVESDEKANGNLRARVRTNILFYYANFKNYLVLGSSDKSEHMIGYFTKFGDGASDVTPIVSLYKLQVRELAKYLGVPENIILKKSSPHLWKDHEAEKELGIQYEQIDPILYCLFDKQLTTRETHLVTGIDTQTIEKIKQLKINSEHKRLMPQRPEGVPS
jgi:NAD+ synthase